MKVKSKTLAQALWEEIEGKGPEAVTHALKGLQAFLGLYKIQRDARDFLNHPKISLTAKEKFIHAFLELFKAPPEATAIIKMLHIHNKKQHIPFADSMRKLNIVPVAISYEYDPCDVLKATEMQAREDASYVKREGEDVESILRGIALPKGRVHIQFGAPLQGEYHAADEVAAAIDQAIVAGYRLFPSNLVAYEQLQKVREAVSSLQDAATQMLANVDTQELARKASEFSARISGYPKRVQNLILEMYANPLLSKFQLQQDQLEHPA